MDARRGKSLSVAALEFRHRLGPELEKIEEELRLGTFYFGAYRRFEIKDPKKRTICAAPFRERVVHHAMMNALGPCLERFQIHHSYACRIGKGTERAVRQAFALAKRWPYFLKLDVRKYYDSIDHALLFKSLRGRIKDRRILDLLSQLLSSYETRSGKGLPIGNLTSQYFANHYLSLFDHYVQRSRYGGHYLRYMDDMVFFLSRRDQVMRVYRESVDFHSSKLSLSLKEPVMGRVKYGVPFLGFLVFPDRIRLLASNKRRFKRNAAIIEQGIDSGRISEEEAGRRATALVAVRSLAKCHALARSIWYDTGEEGPKATTASFAAARGTTTP